MEKISGGQAKAMYKSALNIRRLSDIIKDPAMMGRFIKKYDPQKLTDILHKSIFRELKQYGRSADDWVKMIHGRKTLKYFEEAVQSLAKSNPNINLDPKTISTMAEKLKGGWRNLFNATSTPYITTPSFRQLPIKGTRAVGDRARMDNTLSILKGITDPPRPIGSTRIRL